MLQVKLDLLEFVERPFGLLDFLYAQHGHVLKGESP